jgi:hypothetical protein
MLVPLQFYENCVHYAVDIKTAYKRNAYLGGLSAEIGHGLIRGGVTGEDVLADLIHSVSVRALGVGCVESVITAVERLLETAVEQHRTRQTLQRQISIGETDTIVAFTQLPFFA